MGYATTLSTFRGLLRNAYPSAVFATMLAICGSTSLSANRGDADLPASSAPVLACESPHGDRDSLGNENGQACRSDDPVWAGAAARGQPQGPAVSSR